jgi:pimeloyl-ACP methyl ester carboxylesterase
LLIHGFSASLHTWSPWVERLGDEYRILSLDLPGHGLTRAPAGYHASIEAFRDEVAAFVQAQGLTRFALAGNSMGGHVAWEYALAHPEQIEALVLVDSAGWPETPTENGAIAFQLLRNPVASAIMRDLDKTSLVRQGLIAGFPAHPELVDDAMVTRFTELARAPGHRDIIFTLFREVDARPMATPERLSALGMPVLVMHGAEDALIPLAHGEQFHNAIAGSQLSVFEGAGHMPQTEIPDESAMAIREFLYRVHEGPALATAAE